MSTDPAPSVTRGDITLQPAYFTSSLFVDPLRGDIAKLVQNFTQAYLQGHVAVRSVNGERSAAGMGPDENVSMQVTGEGGRTATATNRSFETTPSADATQSNSTLVPIATSVLGMADESPATGGRSSSAEVPASLHPQPFELFKQLWRTQGWSWLHLRVFDGRARESFVTVVLRLFSEYFADDKEPLAKVVALFGLYTFFVTQPTKTPSSSTSPLPGPSLYRVKHIALSYDTYGHLLSLPTQLTTEYLYPLSPYVTYLLSSLLKQDVFHIHPHSSLQTSHSLPRERFIGDGEVEEVEPITEEGLQKKVPKKKGRPAKRERVKKAYEAFGQLEKWLDKSTYTYTDAALADDTVPSTAEAIVAAGGNGKGRRTTHTLISHPPHASLAIYKKQKTEYLDAIDPSDTKRGWKTELLKQYQLNPAATHVSEAGSSAVAGAGNPEQEREKAVLKRANEAMLARLKKIDEMAAEQGLEVGGEGGEMTGLARMDRAVREMREETGGGRRGGILNLIEGAGLEGIPHLHSDDSAPAERAG
ncbi:hypothetical protein BDW22DRAFT_1424690 [Trametopsis cervina]|nr:hypothetical protein BDW22DRAFT_1424690 [Trametopsis cervina]